MSDSLSESRFTAWLSLFASSGTLICCALPSLLVALGMGAAMAGLVSTVPQLVWLSQYKAYVFASSALMLTFASIMQYRARNAPCPIDPKQAEACTRTRKISKVVLIVSIVIWALGAFFAFVAPYVLV